MGKYEVGRTIGEGTFAKVKFAQNTETGDSLYLVYENAPMEVISSLNAPLNMIRILN